MAAGARTAPLPRAAAAALLAAAAACRGAGEPPALAVDYSGCEVVLAGPACALGEERRLRLWVDVEPGVEIRVDGAPPDGAVPVAGGLRFEVEPAAGTREVRIEACRDGRCAVWSLPLAAAGRPAWLREAWESARTGDTATARRLAEARLDSPRAADRGQALGLLARLDLRGDQERAMQRLLQAVAAHHQGGNLSDEVRDATLAAYRLMHERRFAEARAVLDPLPEPRGDADTAYHLAVNRALLAGLTGDVRGALAELGPAAERAVRLDRDWQRMSVEHTLAGQLLKVGRFAEAEAVYARLQQGGAGELAPCRRLEVVNSRAWGRLLAGEAGMAAGEAMPLLEEALHLVEEECLDRPAERVNVRINLALAHLHAGRTDLARRYLDEARRLDPAPPAHLLLWWRDLEARIHFDGGDAAAALAAYERLARDAAASASPEAAWRADVGRGRVLASRGDADAALAAFAAAEARLDEEILLVPMDEGRSSFVAQREGATRHHLDLLLAVGRDAEALAVARRARSRVLRSLRRAALLGGLPAAERRRWDEAVAAHQQQRAEVDRAAAEHWRLPSGALERALAERVERLRALRSEIDRQLSTLAAAAGEAAEPPSLAAGDLLLAYHPLSEGWVGFAAGGGRVVARRLAPLDGLLDRPHALAERLLAPFAAQVAAAHRVRFLAYGALDGVDLHALPFAGAPLIDGRPVVYAADLPPPPAAATGRALVVADPLGDLPAARREADEVAAALAGRPVERLTGAGATAQALRRRLQAVDHFHYAGHARFAGWDSSLPLAAGSLLTLDDVLVLPHAPAVVVLSGCETGRRLGAPGVESLGLAHAFLAAGAGSVIAAVRPVPDADAARLSIALHRALAAGAAPEEALRRAQLELRAADPDSAWSAFRAFAP